MPLTPNPAAKNALISGQTPQQNQHQTQQQKFQLTPQLLLGQKLLQLPALALQETLYRAVEENPFLELQPSTESPPEDNFPPTSSFSSEFKPQLPVRAASLSKAAKATSTIIEETVSATSTLSAQLLTQLGLIYDSTTLEHQIGQEIIFRLNKAGFFEPPQLTSLAEELSLPVEKIQTVLEKIRTFDPPGIAAADLRQALLRQLEELQRGGERPLTVAKEIVLQCFSLLAERKDKAIARKLSLPLEVVKKAIKQLSFLSPSPAASFKGASREINAPVAPEILVEETNGLLEARLVREALPRLRFNATYARQLAEWKRRSGRKESTAYNQNEKQERAKAQQLLQAVQFRESNLLKVVRYLVEQQRDFFLQGPRYLKPFTLLSFAEALKLNKGTVSRTVKAKYLSCRWGIFPLSFFFSSALLRREGPAASARVVKQVIKELLEIHPERKLTDEALRVILQKKGYTLSRRTVTKYRNSLKLLSSYYRS